MDTDIASLIEDLESNIDDLESALKPLLDTPISATAAKLPVLDKAKLYVLATYAIESLIFSHVRLTGADVKAHPVCNELSRVKQYFGKIDAVENPVGKRTNLTLNKPAAVRFIQAGLNGNEKYDQEVRERKAREKEGAGWKLEQLNKKRKLGDVEDSVMETSSASASQKDDPSEGKAVKGEEGARKNMRVKASDEHEDGALSERMGRNKRKRRKSREAEAGKESVSGLGDFQTPESEQTVKKRKKRSKKQLDED